MKNLIIIFSLLIVSLSYGANTLDYKKENQAIDLCKIESNKFTPEKVLECKYTSTTTTTTNPDGSMTSTTTTSVACDTVQELALFNTIMIVMLSEL